MTNNDFRRMALSFPEAIEGQHMGHPDFRVAGKIFATLWPKVAWGMVKLTPKQQKMIVAAEPAVYVPVKGGWGRQGCTNVVLKKAKKGSVRSALEMAWLGTAPKKLAKEYEDKAKE